MGHDVTIDGTRIDQADLWHDITTSVDRAMDVRLDLLNEGSLVQRSDALLAG